MSEALKLVRDTGVLEITIDRPKANAIDSATSRAMGHVFKEFRDDPDLKVAILTAAGDRFFSPGWDLKEGATGAEKDAEYSEFYGIGGFGGIQELPNLNKPVICAVNGLAFGGGFEIMIACDIIIAAEHATFALPEINVGVFADAATVKLRRRIPYHIAVEMLMLGEPIDAQTAARWGLVNHVVPADQVMAKARELARKLADGPPLVFAAIKQVMRETEAMKEMEGLKFSHSRALHAVKAAIESEDQLEGTRAFAEKRKPVWKGR